MAAATHVLPLGLLRMRAFMKWVLSLHLSPSCDFCHSVTVTRSCIAALRHWRKADFYAHGAPLGGHKVAEGGNDRRILDRMGSYRGGQNSEQCVAKHTPLSPYKLFGAPYCLEGSE